MIGALALGLVGRAGRCWRSPSAPARCSSRTSTTGFWLINQYFGMSVPDTLKTWSAMETLISVFGMACVLLLSAIV